MDARPLVLVHTINFTKTCQFFNTVMLARFTKVNCMAIKLLNNGQFPPHRFRQYWTNYTLKFEWSIVNTHYTPYRKIDIECIEPHSFLFFQHYCPPSSKHKRCFWNGNYHYSIIFQIMQWYFSFIKNNSDVLQNEPLELSNYTILCVSCHIP